MDPAKKQGLKAGDRIMVAGNDTLSGKNIENSYVLKTLKGKPNTPVDLKVYRKSENKELPFTIVRGEVPIKSVDAHYMLNEELGVHQDQQVCGHHLRRVQVGFDRFA